MSRLAKQWFFKTDWPMVLLPITVLLVYLYYVITFVFLAPYPGITFVNSTNGWRVLDSVDDTLNINDVITQINDLTYEQFLADRLRVPFSINGSNKEVMVRVSPDDRMVSLRLQPPTLENGMRRFLPTVSFFPFWLAGTAVLLLLRPRDRRWRLLVLFFFLTAIWVVTGTTSSWRIGGSRIVLGAACWLLVPIILDLHLTVPTPRFRTISSYLLPPLYALAVLLAILELFQIPPQNIPLTTLLLAILSSLALLGIRFAATTSSSSERVATRLMLAGIVLAFGPGVLEVLMSHIRPPEMSGVLSNSIALIALPILPLFYIYAIYKRQLGLLEFRANRLLTMYTFILLYPPVFLVLLLLGERWIQSAGTRTIYLLAAAIGFVLATPPLLARLETWINRLAYGTEHNPEDIIRLFANQIPSALKRERLVQLITHEMAPCLLIRQSALLLFEEHRIVTLYADGVETDLQPRSRQQIHDSLTDIARYRSPMSSVEDELNWVRLTLPLTVRDEAIGVWLFGRRDPDDFYPQSDIDLLRTLANQIAPVIENIRLYEALQWQADHLAEEVTRRTAELRAERDRTQAILDSAGEGIFFADPDGIILYVNPAMSSMSGWGIEETLGQRLDFRASEAVGSETHAEMWDAISHSRGWSGELLQRRSDETTYDVRLTLAPIHSEGGQIAGYVGVESDISKLKEVDRLKSNILSNVSHELKTPLTNIKMYLTLLERGRSERWHDYLVILNRESDRLTHLIQDLLDLSRLDTGLIETELEPVSLPALITKVVDSCRPQAAGKEINLKVDFPDDLPAVKGDGGQLEQVLTNLLINAIHYTLPTGSITVGAGVGIMLERPAIWLSVKDTGIGVSNEDLPHLFERFYRGRAGEESGIPGTGLGLAICKEIIERHHGKIEVESQLDAGSTFTCWLTTVDSQPNSHREKYH